MAFGNPYYSPFYQQPVYYPQSNGAVPDAMGQYKNPYQQQMLPAQMPGANPMSQPMNNDMLWVLGEVEATSYPVAPGNTVVLWDKDQPTIYIKSVNAQGVPSKRILDYTERTEDPSEMPQKHTCQCGKNFVRADEFDTLRDKLEAMESKYESLSEKIEYMNAKSKKLVKEDVDNA